MQNIVIGAAIAVAAISLVAVHAIENYAPVHKSTACVNGVCATVQMSKNDMREACRAMGEMMPVKPESPCGRVLGL